MSTPRLTGSRVGVLKMPSSSVDEVAIDEALDYLPKKKTFGTSCCIANRSLVSRT
jgi:hypothetical protein